MNGHKWLVTAHRHWAGPISGTFYGYRFALKLFHVWSKSHDHVTLEAIR